MIEFERSSEAPMTTSDTAVIVFISAPSAEVAEGLARSAVEARLVACVHIVPGVRSIYRWEGKVCSEGELLLLAKTMSSKRAELEEFIRQQHPYDTPEFIALHADAVAPRYAAWLQDAVTADVDNEPR